MDKTENIAYCTLRTGNTTAFPTPARTKTAATQRKKRMSVEEYFGKVSKNSTSTMRLYKKVELDPSADKDIHIEDDIVVVDRILKGKLVKE